MAALLYHSQWEDSLDAAWQQELAELQADAVVVGPASRCALWYNLKTHAEGYGCIGQLVLDQQDAAEVLQLACATLQRHGCRQALLPMDGSTWRSYRFAERHHHEAAPFVMEPWQPAWWLPWCQDHGWSSAEQYISKAISLPTHDPRAERMVQRMRQAGVALRPIHRHRLEEDLRQVHALSLAAFSANKFYQDIDVDRFVAQYLPYADYMDPEFVLLAEDDQGLAGFVFALPDVLQQRRGQQIDRLIVKTLAVRSERRYAGLGALLTLRVQEAAYRRGFGSVIHALIHHNNYSNNIYPGDILRRYHLLSRELS